MSDNQLKIFDASIGADNMQSRSLELLSTVRPDWKTDDVKFIHFTDGITNKLMGAHLASDAEKKDVVLIRIYGEGSDLMIDRDLEMLNMMILHAAGCAKQLYGKFNNGILYGYVPGKCVDYDTLRDPVVIKLFCKEMVRMMAIDPDTLDLPEEAKKIQISKEPCLFQKCWKFFNLLPDVYPDPKQEERRQNLVKSKAEIEKELKEIESVCTALDCPVVFCHNDLLLGNIVYDEKSASVTFIDYEYGAFNYLPYDIGNHFCEYAGIEPVDYSRYPDKNYQMTWIRQFLECKAENEGQSTSSVTDEQVNTLYAQANKFALAAHLFWGLWGLIQARYSVIDFDYLEYAVIRFNEYYRRKAEFLAL